jgi:hypothetical protein
MVSYLGLVNLVVSCDVFPTSYTTHVVTHIMATVNGTIVVSHTSVCGQNGIVSCMLKF